MLDAATIDVHAQALAWQPRAFELSRNFGSDDHQTDDDYGADHELRLYEHAYHDQSASSRGVYT